MKDNTPVGVAQKKVLDAIGAKAETWQEACRIFEKAGIVVGAKRVGRSSEPVVTLSRNAYGAGWNTEGDADPFDLTSKEVIAKVKQWME